jgi:polar amino acid transport system substrate-binding protein
MATSVVVLSMIFALTGCASTSYVPPSKEAVLTTPTIGQEGILRVGVNASKAPFAGQSSNKIIGLDVDIAAALADELGLKLQVVDVGSDPDTALEEGTVDIVMGVDKTDTSINCWTSNAYIQSTIALFAASSTAAVPKTSDSSIQIAAQLSSMSAWEVGKQFDSSVLVPTEDLKTAFSDLVAGQVDYVAADAAIGTYSSKANSFETYIVALMQKPNGYAIGVLDSNTNLKTAISETLNTLSTGGMVSLIEKQWLGVSLDLSEVSLTEAAQSSATSSTSSTNTSQDSEDTSDSENDSTTGNSGTTTGIGTATESGTGANTSTNN